MVFGSSSEYCEKQRGRLGKVVHVGPRVFFNYAHQADSKDGTIHPWKDVLSRISLRDLLATNTRS